MLNVFSYLFSEQLFDDNYQHQNTYNGFGLPPLPPTSQIPVQGQGSARDLSGHQNSRPPSGSSVKARSASVLSTARKEMVITFTEPRNFLEAL